MISFVMPAKDVSRYVREAIDALIDAEYKDWELIVVEDHSSDDSLAILKDAEKQDPRIKIVTNNGSGKVVALNYGYSLTNGEIVKCIDADDVLAASFFDYIDDFAGYDASSHDYYVTKDNLKVLCECSLNRSFFNENYNYCLENLVSLPRWVWCFKRHIGNMIFPMPENLPFEDVWFSLIIKKYAKIKRVDKPLYYYRQHDNQVFGGILNFDKKTVTFRARRMIKLIEALKQDQTRRLSWGTNDNIAFKHITAFYVLLAKSRLTLGAIILSDVPVVLKLKLLVYRKFNWIAPWIIRLKWLLDKAR